MKLYVDLDGVLADFDGSFPRIFGVNHKEISEEKMWDLVASDPKFYTKLNKMPGAMDFLEKIEIFHPIILTSCPKICFKDAVIAKRFWVEQYIQYPVQFIPVRGGKNKALYMEKRGDILIDDWFDNIKSWEEMGGYGIFHKDFNTSFKDIFEYLETLNFLD